MIGITKNTPLQSVGKVKLMEFSDYRFNCHYLGDLIGGWLSDEAKPALTEAQEKDFYILSKKDKLTEKQAEKLNSYFEKIKKFESKKNTIELTQATKSVLHTIWTKEVVGIKQILKSKAVRRGNSQEDESIDLVNQVFGGKLLKNQERFNSSYFTGEPDLITENSIIDIKTCESWETFWSKTEKKANDEYFYQVWAYMLLTNKSQGFIAYTLPSYNSEFIAYAQSSVYTLEDENQTFLNHNFDRIPMNKRVKIYKIEKREIDTNKVYKYLDKCREYLNNLTTQYNNFKPYNY